MTLGKIAGIILSAGKSTRMQGAFKPLLPLGSQSVLERSIKLFQKSGICDVRAVTGCNSSKLSELIKNSGAKQIYNPSYETGMFSSVQAGIASLEPDIFAFFILPVDIPLVRKSTIIRLLDAFRENSASILYPNFKKERGHPPLISAKHAKKIINWQGNGGLRAFLNQYEHKAEDIAVADECMLMDMDTPDDYQKITDKYAKYHILSVLECSELMQNVLAVDEQIFRHCQAVSKIAQNIGKSLNTAGCNLNLDLITSAALVHDLARTQPHHAQAGAQMLRDMGFEQMADIVAVHMEIAFEKNAPITEAAVVHLADKLVRGDQPVSLKDRFARKMEKYGNNPEARAKIERRLKTACNIKALIEKITIWPEA